MELFRITIRHTIRLFRAPSFLLVRPSEIPGNLLRLAWYIWGVGIRRKKLLVLERSGGIGDLVCLLSCVIGLRARHPNSWLVIITPTGCWRLAASSGLCDVASDTGGFFHRFVCHACAPSRYYAPQLPDARNPPEPQQIHLAAEFARALGVELDFFSVNFRATRTARRRIDRLLRINSDFRPILVIHVGPTWPVREWPAERWLELGNKLHATQSALVIQIGTDLETGRQLLRPTVRIPFAVDWVNKLDFVDFVALLERTNAFVGIDSGPLHIATTLGVPSVAIFGSTRAELRVHPRADTTVINSTVACAGCQHHPTGPLHWRAGCHNDIMCMKMISSNQVLKAITRALAGMSSEGLATPFASRASSSAQSHPENGVLIPTPKHIRHHSIAAFSIRSDD